MPFAWKHAATPPTGKHIVIPELEQLSATELDTAVDTLILTESARNQPLPHPDNDEHFLGVLKPFFKSGWIKTEFQAEETENIVSASERLLQLGNEISPATLTLNRAQIYRTTQRILLGILGTFTYAQNLLDFAEEQEKKQTEFEQKFDKLQGENRHLHDENNRLSVQQSVIHTKPCNHPEEISDLRNQLQTLKDKYDDLDTEYLDSKLHNEYEIQRQDLLLKRAHKDLEEHEKLLTLLPDTHTTKEFSRNLQELQNQKRHADELARALTNNLLEWESVGLTILPNADSIPPPALDASIQVTNLINALAAVTASGMATSSKATGSGMITGELSEADCATIWNQIPNSIRKDPESGPTQKPKTSVELLEFLHQLDCGHPRELAVVTGDLTGAREWDESIGIVQDLMNQDEQPPPARYPETRKTKLFKANEVPKFTNTKSYNLYRNQLRRFLQVVEQPDPEDYRRALALILTTFEDPTAQAVALSWDVDLTIRDTWEHTIDAFLEALDDKFQSPNALPDAMREFMKCWPKKEETASDFFNRFEAVTAELTDIQKRCGVPPASQIGPAVITNRLIQIIPIYLVNHVRMNLLGKQPPQLIETMQPVALRKLFEQAWEFVPKPAKITETTTQGNPRARNAPASSGGTPQSGYNETKQRPCGNIVSYDTSPAVNQMFRGSIYPDPKNPQNNAANATRRELCAKRHLCVYCRRPRSEHHKVGTNFKEVTHDNARALVAPAGQQLQIEAAPAPEQPVQQ